MRTTGFLVLVLGLVLAVGGLVMGFGQYAGWNGRNTLVVLPLEPGVAADTTFVGRHGRRYWLAVQAQVERGGEGAHAPVAFKMPLVLALRDETGHDVLSAAGWFDPAEPPTTLLGNVEGVPGQGPVIVERRVGPFPVMASGLLRGLVEVGPDHAGGAPPSSLRLVVYDDGLPPSISAPFAVAGVGALTFVVGLGLVVAAFIRRIARGGPRGAGAGRKRA